MASQHTRTVVLVAQPRHQGAGRLSQAYQLLQRWAEGHPEPVPTPKEDRHVSSRSVCPGLNPTARTGSDH